MDDSCLARSLSAWAIAICHNFFYRDVPVCRKVKHRTIRTVFLVFWRNMTALPPGIEEAAFIFHVSRGNWPAAFSAPILQYFATIDNLSVDQNYDIQVSVGPRWFEGMSTALRPIVMNFVNT